MTPFVTNGINGAWKVNEDTHAPLRSLPSCPKKILVTETGNNIKPRKNLYNLAVSEHGLLVAFGQALPSLNRHSSSAFAAIPCLPEGHSKSSWWKTPAAAKTGMPTMPGDSHVWPHFHMCLATNQILCNIAKKWQVQVLRRGNVWRQSKMVPTCSNKNPTNRCSQKAQFGTMQDNNMEFAWTSWDDAGEPAGLRQWKQAPTQNLQQSAPGRRRISFYRWWNGEMVLAKQVQCIVPSNHQSDLSGPTGKPSNSKSYMIESTPTMVASSVGPKDPERTSWFFQVIFLDFSLSEPLAHQPDQKKTGVRIWMDMRWCMYILYHIMAFHSLPNHKGVWF